MAFKAGTSGNPQGRPKGTNDKRTELRTLLEPHAPALIQKAVDMALAGDTTALKLCIDRLIPAMRSVEVDHSFSEQPVKFAMRMGKSLDNA